MPIRSCFLLALWFGWAHGISAEVLYSLTDLGTLTPPGGASFGIALNSSGQVVGESFGVTGNTHAFLYSDGSMQDLHLGTLPNGVASANAINDSGQVAGYGQIIGEVGPHGSTNFLHAFLYSSGSMQDLGTLGGPSSQARGINSAGQLTGVADTPPDANGRSHAFLYANGQMRDLGTLGGPNSAGSKINSTGQVTGSADTTTGATHAFVYNNGQMTDLGTLPGHANSDGVDLNDSGQVVGRSRSPGGLNDHAFLYSNGEMTPLGTLGEMTVTHSALTVQDES